MKLTVATLALFATHTHAACPNACSGHGACGKSDACTCYPDWINGDCGARQCPHSVSWASGHGWAECGDRGVCDRKTGVCECYDGFEGRGCKRLSCPDPACGGHGVCRTMKDVDSAYTGWDKDKIQMCVCDAGWTGPTCEARKCPRGDDVMTEVDSSNVDQVAMVQTITVENNAGNTALVGDFTLSFTDWRGETWTTFPISAIDSTAVSIQQALEALPNHAVPTVTVDAAVRSNTDSKVVFTVTFSDSYTPGTQTLLQLNAVGCSTNGCQPNYAGVTDVKTSTSLVAVGTAATTENYECSNRGRCNSEEGICECYPGYFGQSCEGQTIVM